MSHYLMKPIPWRPSELDIDDVHLQCNTTGTNSDSRYAEIYVAVFDILQHVSSDTISYKILFLVLPLHLI